MKFKYKKYGPSVLRPVILIEIEYKGISVPYEVLVDSGADANIFDAQIGEILKIDIESGERKEVSGITGVSQSYYVHPVKINVGGWQYKAKVGFLPNIAHLGHGVVGQKGFFDIFVVKFDLVKEIIELHERKK